MGGGDTGYYYMGTYVVAHEKIEATVKIQRYKTEYISVFGDTEHIVIKLSGIIEESTIEMSGQLENVKILVTATKREHLSS